MQGQGKASKEKTRLATEMDEVKASLREANAYRKESARNRRLNEAIAVMKELFPVRGEGKRYCGPLTAVGEPLLCVRARMRVCVCVIMACARGFC